MKPQNLKPGILLQIKEAILLFRHGISGFKGVMPLDEHDRIFILSVKTHVNTRCRPLKKETVYVFTFLLKDKLSEVAVAENSYCFSQMEEI